MDSTGSEVNANVNLGFWGDAKCVKSIKSIWEQTPEEVEANSKPKRCLVRGPNVERYPKPSQFDLKALMTQYSKKPCGEIEAQPGSCLVQQCTVPGATEDFGLSEVMKNCQFKSSNNSSRSSSRGAGCNRDDAAEFAGRYGVDIGPKPSLYYRLRKGKYRREF